MRLIVTICLLVGSLLVTAAASGVPAPRAQMLRLSDLPPGYAVSRLDEKPNAKVENLTLAETKAMGRITGWETEFELKGSTASLLTKPAVIESGIALFKSPKGAAMAVVHPLRTKKGVRYQRISIGGVLGHQARAYSVQVEEQGQTIEGVAIQWRWKSKVAFLVSGGYAGSVDAAETVALARKVQARIAAAG